MATWMILDYLQVDTDPNVILDKLNITEEYGTFTISIALLFHDLGFDTVFRTVEDLDKHKDESPLYNKAEKKGLKIKPPLEADEFNQVIKSGKHLIVFYDEEIDQGHFSPVEAINKDIIKLPMSNYGDLSVLDFQERRARLGFLKQTVEIQPMKMQNKSCH